MFSCNLNSFSRRLLQWAALAMVGLVISGCGGSSGPASPDPIAASCVPSDPSTSDQCGTVLVSVTDAEGDFVSYTVDILSLSLRRADGASVETLPNTTRIDFAQLSDLSELVSVATLAPGDIVGGTIRLDYSAAEIFVEAGGNIVAADIVAADGAPLGIVELDIRLADRDHLILTRGRAALLSLDFDLAVSHEVDTTLIRPQVTTRPYIVAEVRPIDEKELRIRGALVDVDVANSSYDIRLRPWHRRDGDHGPVTVHTTSTTSFEIGATLLSGTAGLEALADLAPGTLTVAFGSLNVQSRTFTAEIVHARDSVGDDTMDAVYGNVVARNGDQLTVKGAIAVHRDRPARFHRTVLIALGPDTKVIRQIDHDAMLNKDDISVGQRIVAFGQLAETDVNVDVNAASRPDVALLLDATQGRVRMLVTRLRGRVNSVVAGQINMRLRGIDRLGIDLFDFSGTGIDADNNADPEDYEIRTETLALDKLVADEWAAVLGFVVPFGTAPPDFNGRTVIDHRNLPAAFGIGWSAQGTAVPFVSMGPDQLVPDLNNQDIDQRHHMLLGDRLVDLLNLPSSPAIVPSTEASVFGIQQRGQIQLFRVFADFVEALTLALNTSDRARSMAAFGQYDEATNTLTVRRIAIHMIPAD